MEPEVNRGQFGNEPPAKSRPAISAFRRRDDDTSQEMLTAAATSAIWMGCLIVGILGVVLPDAREHLQEKPAPPVEAVRLMPPREQAPDMAPPQAAPRPDAAPQPDSPAPEPEAPPPVVAVAAPSPFIAFAVPVEGPTRIVDARLAVPVAPHPAGPQTPPVHHLTFGVGEGQQPDPDYPREAQLAGEEGTVVIRFTVGQDGRVVSAAVSQPCRWPLLNQAAMRGVRDRWHFRPGNAGVYDVPIQFVQ